MIGIKGDYKWVAHENAAMVAVLVKPFRIRLIQHSIRNIVNANMVNRLTYDINVEANFNRKYASTFRIVNISTEPQDIHNFTRYIIDCYSMGIEKANTKYTPGRPCGIGRFLQND